MWEEEKNLFFFWRTVGSKLKENVRSEEDEPIDVGSNSPSLQATNTLDSIYTKYFLEGSCLQQTHK